MLDGQVLPATAAAGSPCFGVLGAHGRGPDKLGSLRAERLRGNCLQNVAVDGGLKLGQQVKDNFPAFRLEGSSH